MGELNLLGYLTLWGALGIVLFSAFVVVAFRTGLVFTARKDDGTLKREIPLRGVFAMAIMPLTLIGLHLLSNYYGLFLKGISTGFWPLFLLNYGVYTIFFVYDTLVIDGIVLGIWRPKILRLPDVMGKESMRKHILVSLPVGIFLGAILTLTSTGISYSLWMKH